MTETGRDDVGFSSFSPPSVACPKASAILSFLLHVDISFFSWEKRRCLLSPSKSPSLFESNSCDEKKQIGAYYNPRATQKMTMRGARRRNKRQMTEKLMIGLSFSAFIF